MSKQKQSHKEIVEEEEELFRQYDGVLTAQPSEEDLERVREYFRQRPRVSSASQPKRSDT